jgi:hypothetical protein
MSIFEPGEARITGGISFPSKEKALLPVTGSFTAIYSGDESGVLRKYSVLAPREMTSAFVFLLAYDN